MVTESEALQRILATISPLPEKRVSLIDALDKFSMQTVHALVPLPGFDNSAMDGYAVRAQDTVGKEPLEVIGEQPAGLSKKLTLPPGKAIRIFTGAPMPDGADAVIMQEDVTREAEGKAIACKEPVELHENVRRTGCDPCVGQRVLDKGEQLTATRLAVLASQGLNGISISGSPKVAILTTGDELVKPGQALQTGQLYNSNQTMLHALVKQLGVEKITVQHVADDLSQTADALRQLIAEHDFLILSGGVSVGSHDFVKPALQGLRLSPEFWRVKVKPGKPLLYVSAPRGEAQPPCHLFGLPGNPVSSFVTYQLFVRPALLKLMGAAPQHLALPSVKATLKGSLKNPGSRPHYVRGYVNEGVFSPSGVQQSHALFGLSQSNALLRMEPEQTLREGDALSVLMT